MPDLDKHNLEVKELNPFQEFGISIFLIALFILVQNQTLLILITKATLWM